MDSICPFEAALTSSFFSFYVYTKETPDNIGNTRKRSEIKRKFRPLFVQIEP